MLHRIAGAWDARSWHGPVTFDGSLLDPTPSQRLRNHSPDGFAWGYAGSGPAQLALACLLAAGIDRGLTLRHYQAFKREHLAALPLAAFTLEIDLDAWVAERERQRDRA